MGKEWDGDGDGVVVAAGEKVDFSPEVGCVLVSFQRYEWMCGVAEVASACDWSWTY